MENGLKTDCFITGLPHSLVGNLPGSNLCNSEITCISLSGVMSSCSSHRMASSWLRDVIVWEAEVVGRVCARLDLHFRTVQLSSSPRQLFPGEHNAWHHFQLRDDFLKCLSEAPWILMGF